MHPDVRIDVVLPKLGIDQKFVVSAAAATFGASQMRADHVGERARSRFDG